MNKMQKAVLAVLLIPALLGTINAATQYMGQIVQSVKIDQTTPGTTNGVQVNAALPTGSNSIGAVGANLQILGATVDTGKANAGTATQRVVLASDQPAVAVSAASLPLPTGAATESTLSTLNTKVTAVNTGAVVLAAGTAEIGKLGAGTAVIGSLAANQSVNTAQINGVTVLMGNGATGTGSQRVTIASDNSPVPVAASPATSANVTKANVTATGTSAQLIAAESTRRGIECVALCANTDYVYLNINSASAATSSDQPMSPCSSWEPHTVVPVGAIQVIAGSGSQVVRCVSYLP